MATEEERKTMIPPLEDLEKKASCPPEADPFSTFYFVQDPKVLESRQLTVLGKFLDFMWEYTHDDDEEVGHDEDDKSSTRVEMKLVLYKKTFLSLLLPLDKDVPVEYHSQKVLDRFEEVFRRVPGACEDDFEIALCMTRGPTNTCTPFHCGGNAATSTSQIALNDPSEYKGGELCYFVNGSIRYTERCLKGSLVQHSANVLHGVTQLTEGTRKSLFLVDPRRGPGKKGYKCATMTVTGRHVKGYRESLIPKLPVCIICTEEVATRAIDPCGHVCFCEVCVQHEIELCPLCRTKITKTLKLFI